MSDADPLVITTAGTWMRMRYSLGRQFVEYVLLFVFCKFPLLAQQPLELSENIIQNLLYKLPPQSVDYDQVQTTANYSVR